MISIWLQSLCKNVAHFCLINYFISKKTRNFERLHTLDSSIFFVICLILLENLVWNLGYTLSSFNELTWPKTCLKKWGVFAKKQQLESSFGASSKASALISQLLSIKIDSRKQYFAPTRSGSKGNIIHTTKKYRESL